jgi:hypothetical protein
VEDDKRQAALAAIKTYMPKYQTYDNYYDGEHRLTFASDKYRNAFGNTFKAFADNLCATVVDATSDRLTLIRFDTDSETISENAWNLWNVNRMDRGSGQLHVEALTSGDAYLIVWPDAENNPRFYVNRARGMTVGYDDEQPGLVTWAGKVWKRSDHHYRMTMYYADRIEKYVTREKHEHGGYPEKPDAWEPFQPEGERWPLENPWEQVPVFHFANNAGVGEWGRSELRDVIPLQDALNKAMADMLVAMEFNALPQRWATGLVVEVDPETGRPPVMFQPGGVWAVGDPAVRFGEFAASNLTQFTDVHETIRREIAVVSRTPGHYITPPQGDFPSGESLKTAEASFLAKVTDRQVAFGNVWEDAMHLALRMAGSETQTLSAVWEDAAPRSEKEMAEKVQILTSSGASIEGAAKVAGYDDRDVEDLTRTDSVNGLLP